MFKWVRNKFQGRSLTLSQMRQVIYGPPSIAGITVSEEGALALTAVYRGASLWSSTMATMDVEVTTFGNGGRVWKPYHNVSLLLRDPNDDQNHVKFWKSMWWAAVLSGNSFAEIERSIEGTPIGLHRLDWRNVELCQNPDGTLYYKVRSGGQEISPKTISPRDMLHFTMESWDGHQGISPVRALREAIGTAVAADRYAGSVFGNAGLPRGFLRTPQDLTPDVKANIRELWDIIHGGPANANKIGFLGAGMDFVETNNSPADSQLLESRQFNIQEISRILGIPECLLFSGDQSYNANEQSIQQWYALSLRAFIEATEAELDFKLLSRDERLRGVAIKYKVSDLLRGNFVELMNAVSRGVLTGVMTQGEARAKLGLNHIDGTDQLYMPVNMQISTDGKIDTVKGDLKKLTDDRAKEFAREAFLDAVNRALRRQAKRKTDRSYLMATVGPGYRAYSAIMGIEADLGAFLDRWEGLEGSDIDENIILGLVK